MSGNDERDPLDSWLHQQVEPLPPPPGTFELITRRARRRKLRKLAVTVASAAAVAAAAAVAVPNVVALNVSPSRESASSVAGGALSQAGRGTRQTNGSASALPSPGGPAPSLTEPSGPVPPNFQPSSVTFVSPDIGWVIGQAGTPGQCANANRDICTSIVRTDDAGKTWHGGPAPGTTGPNGPEGVSGLRFLDGVNGWAFGPELWVTHDAGNTWHQLSTDGYRVTDLEAAGDRAFALWARCPGTGPTAEFAAGCTSYTLMSTTAGSDRWTPVGGATSRLAHGGLATSAVLALTSTTGYLLAPDGTLFSGPLDGAWQKAGTAGCLPGPARANGLPGDALLALVNSATVVVACDLAGGVQVYTSPDGGASWTGQPASAWAAAGRPASATSLAASPDGTLVLAAAGTIYVLPAGGGKWQRATVQDAPAGGFGYVGMTTGEQGVAVPADPSLHEIWMTFDGGLNWAPRTPITPGS
ncbi:MAG TPA: hypothetical protein VKV38_13390 [Trebonia sp.]|nr:hypothetical protein [Trebonia sp.]